MKNSLLKLLSFTLVAVIICSAVFGVNAESLDDARGDINEVTVTAEEISKSSFSEAVQSKLNTAKNNTDNTILRVKVEPGVYELKKALKVYGNTTLSLYGVTVKKAEGVSVNMLRTGKEDSVSKGVTGYYYENIAVEGGVFDADFSGQTMIKAAHAKNFSMTDITLKNLKNYHMMEVAGIDGFTLKNCAFKNQIINKATSNEICYEAVQLDILKKGHIVNCRSEDLPMKDVLIEGCEFENCPRGVGSHTAILNNPFNNITIKNNKFINMNSAAIQTMGWKNCTISGNYIEKASRAIAVFETSSQGKGTFLPSVIAKEGETEVHASDEYNAPEDSKTVIEYNTIKDCGTVKDEFGSYAASAISAIGYNLYDIYEQGKNGGGGLPIGDYYVNGVTVRNNYVDVKGTACRIENVRNAEVSSNVFYCGDNLFHSTSSFYGISARYGSTLSKVDNNYIKNAEVYGIRIGSGCKADSVSSNTIDSVSTYGIIINQAEVDTVCDNNILNCGSRGIGILSGSKLKNPVERNKISSTAIGIHLAKDVDAFLNCNTLKCMTPAEYTKTAFVNNYGKNYSEFAKASGIYTDVSALELSVGQYYKLKAFTTPINSEPNFTCSVSDESVVSVTDEGFIKALAEGSAEVTVKSLSGKTASVKVTVNKEESDIKTTDNSEFCAINSIYNEADGVNLKWNSITGASQYRVMRKNGGNWTTVIDTDSTSYIDYSVNSGTTYSYTVRAMNADEEFIGGYDPEGSKLTYTAAPALKLTNYEKYIKLSWNKTGGASVYKVYYKTETSGWKKLDTTDELSVNYSSVQSGKVYSFMAVSADSELNPLHMQSEDSISSVKFLSKPALKAEVSGKKIKLSWERISGADKYIVKAIKLNNKKSVWKTVATTVNTSLERTGGYDKSYKFMLSGMDSIRQSSSAFSTPVKVKIKKPKVKVKAKAKAKTDKKEKAKAKSKTTAKQKKR